MSAAGSPIPPSGTWGAQNTPSWDRRSPLPRELGWAQPLLWVQFALTALYVVTVLSVVTYYSGEIFGILVYDSLPSVAGVYLARRLWRGGVWTSRALIAVQAWIVWLSFGTLMHGDLRGITQAAMPVAVIVLLRRARSREWFEIAPQDREERRAFSLERMIRWRRDEGQTAVEYAGLIAVVAAIIVALSVGGLGGRIADGIQSAVCSVTGTACPASQGDGTETGAAEGDDGTGEGGSDADTGGGTGAGPGGDAHADGGVHADGGTGTDGGDGADGGTGTSAGAGSDGQEGTAADAGTDTGGGTGGTNGGSPASAQIITYDGARANDTVPLAPGPFEQRSLWDDVHDQERHDKTFMDHVRGFFVAPTKSFLASTMDVVSDPVGSIKDSWNGLKGYTTDWWGDKADELGKEWDKGDYLSSAWGWVNSPEDFVSDLATDTFVDKENWEKGNYGASVGNTLVGVIGIFSPKTITKFTKFKKLAEVGESLDKAADAAEKARKAAKAGDAEAARKAAKDADEAADAAEKQARESGCTIAAPARRIPYGANPPGTITGSSGTGTTIIAAGPSDSPYVILAEGGCDEDAKEQAKQAREQADEADKAADEAEKKNGSNKPTNEWQAGDDVPGPAAGKKLRFPNKRHTVGGAGSGQVKERNTVILRGNEDLVRADIEAIAKGRAKLLPDKNTYEVNGRTYRVEDTGTVFPVSGPGLVDMDRIEYAALKEIVRNKGDLSKSQQLQRDPKFVNNPDKVAKAKQVYDGTYK